MPPLQAKYGSHLQIKLFDLSDQANLDLFLKVSEAMGMPPYVPFMVVGEKALIGSAEIPEQLPGLIETHLAAGGLDWPSVGGIAHMLQPSEDAGICTPAALCNDPSGAATSVTSAKTGFASGFALAAAIMAGMISSVVYTGVALVRRRPVLQARKWSQYLLPILGIVGLGVSAYLAYVETRAVPAICGPVGDCNAVQSSPYAKLFGILPVGVFGVMGYLAIIGVWLYGRLRTGRLAHYAHAVVFSMTLFGVLFSLYLTYLELFVIKAVCFWCLTSAVIMTLLLLLSIGPIQGGRGRET